jgi:hypothetical protein
VPSSATRSERRWYSSAARDSGSFLHRRGVFRYTPAGRKWLFSSRVTCRTQSLHCIFQSSVSILATRREFSGPGKQTTYRFRDRRTQAAHCDLAAT